MDQELILQALKNACGNKIYRFQIIVQDSQLHIYINRKAESKPDYDFLTDLVTQAIADLKLDALDGMWLYSRKLGEIEPDWQTFVELSTANHTDHLDTLANSKNLNDSFEAEVTSANHVDENSLNLSQYCFITNKQLLTTQIIPPDKNIIRLVKFFHYLSDGNKQKILPALDTYFQSSKIPTLEKLSVGVQNWFKQITELNYDDNRTVALWLSRYCFDSTAAIAEFKAIAEKQAEIADTAKKAKRSQTEYSYTFPDINLANVSDNEQLDKLHLSKFSFLATKKYIFPFVWTIITVVLLILGFYTNNGNNSAQITFLCKNSGASSAYCHLAVNLAGANKIKQLPRSMFPLTQTTTQAATFGCQRYANLKAGVVNQLNPLQTPVISTHGEKVFSHIYVVEVKQKNFQQPGNIRVGCVYTVGQIERSPKLLAADILPLNWPSEAYQKPNNLTFGSYTHFINLGLSTIFSSIAIAIVSRLNLGIKVNNDQTIYLLALFLGILQLIAGELSVLSFIAYITFPVLGILAASLWMKNVQINWNYGYPLVTVGILTIIAIQFLLYGLCFKLLVSSF